MPSLAPQACLSICYVILLRLCRYPSSCNELYSFWSVNIHVLDDFLQLALASIDDDAAIWTLEVAMQQTNLPWHFLDSHQSALQDAWNGCYSSLLRKKLVPKTISAALLVFARRFHAFAVKLGKHTSDSSLEHTTEQESLTAVEAPTTPPCKTSSSVPETPVHLYMEYLENGGAPSPLHPHDSPPSKKFKAWYWEQSQFAEKFAGDNVVEIISDDDGLPEHAISQEAPAGFAVLSPVEIPADPSSTIIENDPIIDSPSESEKSESLSPPQTGDSPPARRRKLDHWIRNSMEAPVSPVRMDSKF